MIKNRSILDQVFTKFLDGPNLFKNREVLRHSYIPDRFPYREKQIRYLGEIIAPALKSSTCSNVIIYGKTGTGKTVVMKYVLKILSKKAIEMGSPLQVSFINCRLAGTEYRIIAGLCDTLKIRVPFTGLARGELFDRFRDGLNSSGKLLIVVLDEIDAIMKDRSDILLYELTRINETLEGSRLSIVGISNDLRFKEYLDPRVISTLSEEEIIFRPYNAKELQDILSDRASLAFSRNVVREGAVSLCAALAAAEHGDARRALDLLRVAGELAEREGSILVAEDHVRRAEKRIEHDRIMEALKDLPTHSKLVLLSVFLLNKSTAKQAFTGEIYNVYSDLSTEIGLSPLTQRRVSGLINEQDSLGLLNTRIVSLGRYGRTKKIRLGVSNTVVNKVFSKDEVFQALLRFIPKKAILPN